ncbi:MAG: PASTA domain-containing protein [Deltaproteobacteria bacterium]|nr:PASTA domain-containing protein [Deltaproteobacteria bacterium]
MKGGKDSFGRNLRGVGGFREDEERKKKVVRLRIYAVLGVIFLLVAAWFLFSGEPAPEQSVPAESEIKEEVPPVPPEKKEEVRRRNIYDRNLRELAISFKVDSIYVKPLEFDNIERTVALLAETLSLEEKDVLEELKAQRTYKWVVKNISPEKATSVAALNLPGVYFYEQEQRFAPNRANTAHIVGEVKDGHGLSGIELFYDNLLLGGAMEPEAVTAGGKGKGLVLTLDAGIQQLMEQEMTELLNELKANDPAGEDLSGVSALVMDAAGGEILSYVRLPAFGGLQAGSANGQEREERMFAGTINPGPLALLFKAAADLEQGQAEAAAVEEVTPENIKPLEPRLMKKMREVKAAKQGPAAQAKSPWVALPDGTYATEWLAALLARQQATEGGTNDFSAFGKIVGRAGPCTVDLPGDNGGRDTGIGLLCGFAALVNGGTGVSPHFLKATLAADGKTEEWPWPQQENKVIGPETSRDLVLFLRERSRAAGQLFFAEILQPAVALPDQTAGVEPAQPAPAEAPPQAAAAASAADKAKQDEGSKPEVKVLPHCDVLALAAVPLANPELVMLIVVDDAPIDLTKSSAVRQHAESLLQAALKLHRQKAAGNGAAESISRQEIFQRWLMKNKLMGFDVTAAGKVDAEKMIDVRGMSIRKAMQELNRFDVKVVIEGSGIVKKQHPVPGSKVAEGSLVVLKAEAKR